jgi:putative transposase
MKRRAEFSRETNEDLSIRRRCFLLGLTRSTIYYQSSDRNFNTVDHMNEIREHYERHPFKGYKRITDDLNDQGYSINHKRVYRLMKLMGLQAIYPKKNLSRRRQEDIVFPYLLKDRPPERVHDCWGVDITYIKTANGFVYLTALIDVVSRCIMGWYLSPYLDTEGCLDALEMAINTGYKPKIINSDQGCQFTSQEWIYSLKLLEIDVSMDGKGRYLDNIFIERFWRTIKYEEVYLKTYETVSEAKESLGAYIRWYNHERRHSSLGKRRPQEVMSGIENKFRQINTKKMTSQSLQIAA